jgi:hypothetical protein
MNERIKELAEQAHMAFGYSGELYGATDELIERFAELVRQDEREACAKFFDANDDRLFWGSAAAKEIRGRTE